MGAPLPGVCVLLSCLHYWLGTSYLLLQWDVSSLPALKSALSPRGFSSFQWRMAIRHQHLGVRCAHCCCGIAACVSSKDRAGIYVYTLHTDTTLRCRNHLNFVPVFVTPLSPYYQYICLFYSSYVTHRLTLCPAAPMFHMNSLLIWLHLWSQDEDAATTLATSSYTY